MWAKRGVCGADLRKQAYGIAIFYSLLAVLGIVYGFILIEDPQLFVGVAPPVHMVRLDRVQKEERDESDQADDGGGDAGDDGDDDDLEELYESASEARARVTYELLVHAAKRNGVEVVLAGILTVALSALLAVGVRRSRSVLLMPWIVQQLVELLMGAGLFVVYAVAGAGFSFLEVALFASSLACSAYLTYSVLALYVLMRRMSKNSQQVISSVMDGDTYAGASGVNYERLQEEVGGIGKEMTTISNSLATNSHPSSPDGAGAAPAPAPVVPAIPPPPVRERPSEENHRRDDIMYFSID